jgi:DNA-binding NarL/FixJ family response regulator
MIRAVIADDHALMREGLKHILKQTEDFEVLALVRKGDFDVLVMDLSMPGRSGMDLIRQIKDEFPQVAVLVLTMHDENQYAARAIRAGALGYMTKESAGNELVKAIRKVHGGRPYISMDVAEQLAMDAMPERLDMPHKSLSDREFEVFNFLVSGKSVTEIAELLHLSVKTVSTHKTRILQKMGSNSLAELVHYAVVHGLLEKFKP